MLTVYDCLKNQHDFRLVLLAAVVCLFSATVAVKLLQRIAEVEGRWRLLGLTFAAGVTGMGIWATHFIAMLAFQPHLPTGYDMPLTLASLAVAVVLVGLAFGYALFNRAPHAPIFGGAALGLAIAGMHYLGMAAFQVQGRVLWDMQLVAASVLIGMAAGAPAVTLALRSRTTGGRVGAILLLTLAICGLHFTAMGAAALAPMSGVVINPSSIPPAWLAACVASGATALLVLSGFALYMEQAQRRAEGRRRQELADTAVEGLVVCDRGIIVTANAAFEALVGLSESEVRGRAIGDFLEAAAAERLCQGAAARFETELIGPDGHAPVELISRNLPFDGRMHQGVAVRDLRARNQADARIRYLAHHDPLTGLANRASFSERLAREMDRPGRKDDSLAVLCVALDRFKPVNDLFGHGAGDQVLRTMATRLAEVLGADDVLARLGGDEFAAIRLGDCRPATLADLADRLLAAIGEEIDVGGGAVRVGASIGIALHPADGETADSLMRNADAALHRAKADGRGAYRFFEPSIGAELLTRQEMEFDLRMAVGRGELSLVYQPQTSVSDGEVFGFEALLRWNHPSRGQVSPVCFIPLAEESDLILSIGEWVLRQACAEAARWSRPLQVAVNISGVQLHAPELPRLVEQVLQETGLAPERLELEVTETALIDDPDVALASLHAIKALGVKVAMDDFGTGYSSLSNLRAFPFDKIKIDQSFVRNVHRNDQAATIVRAIVGLAKGLKLTVLAEGVETMEELAFLNAEMCGEAQGFYFGRPAEIAEFADLLEAPKPRRRRAG